MIPRLKPSFSKKEFIATILRRNNKKSVFEKTFAKKFGTKYGLFFKYGRSALYAFFASHKIIMIGSG